MIPANDNDPRVLISINDACRMIGVSRTFINKARQAGKFPAAVPLGERRVAFLRTEVEAWIQERITARSAAA